VDYANLEIKPEWINKGLAAAWLFGSRVGSSGAKEYVADRSATVGASVTIEEDALITGGGAIAADIFSIAIFDGTSKSIPFSLVVDWERVSGVVSWSFLSGTSSWTGVYAQEAGRFRSVNNNVFNGDIIPTAGTAQNTCGAVANANNDLRGSYRGGAVAVDTTAPQPSSINRVTATAGASSTNNVANAAVARLRLFYSFTGTLSDADLISLSADPYQIFESEEPFRLRHNPRTNKVIPVLSSPTVTDIAATCARPRVTKGF